MYVVLEGGFPPCRFLGPQGNVRPRRNDRRPGVRPTRALDAGPGRAAERITGKGIGPPTPIMSPYATRPLIAGNPHGQAISRQAWGPGEG